MDGASSAGAIIGWLLPLAAHYFIADFRVVLTGLGLDKGHTETDWQEGIRTVGVLPASRGHPAGANPPEPAALRHNAVMDGSRR